MSVPEKAADPIVEMKRIEAMINNPKMRNLRARSQTDHGYIRPRNASTMILVDGEGDKARILMGRRNKSLKFMPGALVFPGGSVDRYDGSAPSASELSEVTRERLIRNIRGRGNERAARALGMAAIRETAEESGILMGQRQPCDTAHKDWKPFADREVLPDLSNLRLFSRAITPPGISRRFDTWFFLAKSDAIAHVPEDGFDPCGELENLQWVKPMDAITSDTREITRVMLAELIRRLKHDPHLDPEYPAPYYHAPRRRFRRDVI